MTLDNVNLLVAYIKIIVNFFRSSLKNHNFVVVVFFYLICLTSTICSTGPKY